MKLSKKWTTVTPLSKAIALAMFVIIPVLTALIGYKLGTTTLTNDRVIYRNIIKTAVDCESPEVKQCLQLTKPSSK